MASDDEHDRLDEATDSVIALLHVVDKLELLKETTYIKKPCTVEWAQQSWEKTMESMLLLKDQNAIRYYYLSSFCSMCGLAQNLYNNDPPVLVSIQKYIEIAKEREDEDYVVPAPLPDSYKTNVFYMIHLLELIADALEYKIPSKGGHMTKPARR